MLLQAFICSLVVLFLHVSTWEDNINGWVSRKTESWPDWIKKPLYDCPVCMSPYWGGVFFLVMWIFGIWTFPEYNVLQLIVYTIGVLMVTAGFSVIWMVVISAYEWFGDEEDFRVEQTINLDEAIMKKQSELDYLKSIKDITKQSADRLHSGIKEAENAHP